MLANKVAFALANALIDFDPGFDMPPPPNVKL